MKRTITAVTLVAAALSAGLSRPTYAAVCGTISHIPTTQCLNDISTIDKEASGDLAVVVADCNAASPTNSSEYADFWREDTMCPADWNQGWGYSSSDSGACNQNTAFGMFIRTVWLMEHAHPAHPIINPRNLDPEDDPQFSTGSEKWLVESGNYLRDKIDWGGRFFAPVNGSQHIAWTLGGFEVKLYCGTWFQQNIVLRASTLIHEARHHDAGTTHCDDELDVPTECYASLPCPDGTSCDPDLAYKGSYWFQLSWLESFHRFADPNKTTYAMRAIARDGANWIADNRFENKGGYFLDDVRNTTRYRSSYASSMFPQTLDILASPQSGELRINKERCGAFDAVFTGHSASNDNLGNGAMTLTSTRWGKRDGFWYTDSSFSSSTQLGGPVAAKILHLASIDPISPRVDADNLCLDGYGTGTALTPTGSLVGPFVRRTATSLGPNVERDNPVRTVTLGDDSLAVFALRKNQGVSSPADRSPMMRVRKGTSWAQEVALFPFASHNTLAGRPIFTPLGVSSGPGRIDLFALFDDMRIRRRSCDDCSTFPQDHEFEPDSDWADIENNSVITLWGYDAVSWGEDRVDLVTDSLTGQVFHRAWDDVAGDQAWESLGNGGGTLLNPVAVSTEHGALDIFAIEEGSGHVKRKHLRSGLGWGPTSKSSNQWEDLGKPFFGDVDVDSLAALTSGTGDVQVFIRAAKDNEPERHLVYRLVKPAGAPAQACFAATDCAPPFGSWQAIDTGRMPGSAIDISIGDRAAQPWVVGTSGSLFEWFNGQWMARESTRTYEAVDVGRHGLITAVATGGDIWKREYNTWTQLPGGALDMGVGNNGDIWVVGRSSRDLLRFNGSGWGDRVTGSFLKVDVGPDGSAYAIDSQNRIWHVDGANPSQVTQLPSVARDISASADGEVVMVGGVLRSGGVDDRLFRLVNGSWQLIRDVAGKRIAAGPDGYVGHIAAPNAIFLY